MLTHALNLSSPVQAFVDVVTTCSSTQIAAVFPFICDVLHFTWTIYAKPHLDQTDI